PLGTGRDRLAVDALEHPAHGGRQRQLLDVCDFDITSRVHAERIWHHSPPRAADATPHRPPARSDAAYTGRMYGYQPPQEDPEGSWLEIFHISRVVLGLLMPPLLVIFAVLALLATAVWLLAIHPFLALLPVGVIALGVWWLVERDKQAHKSLEEELFARRR